MEDWVKYCNSVQEYKPGHQPECYDKFFRPNVCHVCKKTNFGDLISCGMCCMIFYCNDEHKRAHTLQHRELCQHLTKFLRKKEEWGNIRYSHTSEWIQDRQKFLDFIKTRLPRKLKPHEEEIIIYAKSCFYCHQQNNLSTCPVCYSENYCIDHLQEFKSQHESKCQILVLCHNLDIKYLSFISFTDKFSVLNAISLSDDMNKFILQFVCRSIQRSIERWAPDDYFYSDYVSGPLTLYKGMNDTDLLHFPIEECIYVIHVIAANYLDLLYVEAWELFLHCIHRVSIVSIQELIVIIVGSELERKDNDIKLCELCNSHGKTLRSESYSMSYTQYMNSTSYTRPNVIMGIHADFSNERTWPASILKSWSNVCPWFLTTKSKDKAELNIRIIKQVLDKSIEVVCNVKNKFASIRPSRDAETGYVNYRNEYITIYNYRKAPHKPL